MVDEPSSQPSTPSTKKTGPPYPPSPWLVAAVVAVFFFGPIVFLTYLPLMTPGSVLDACLLGVVGFLWVISCYGVIGLLAARVEARWPGAKPFLKGLGFIVEILQAFQGHRRS